MKKITYYLDCKRQRASILALMLLFVSLSFFAGGCPEPEPTKFTVTFNVDGGSAVESQSIVSGGKATKPSTNPTKNGYTFVDWYKDAEKTTVFDFNTAITASVTLYAKWNAIPISSIALNQSTASVDLKATLQLTSTVLPADVPDKSLTWTSSDNAIATVSSTGLVTGLSSGTATITATSVANNTKQATLSLTVTTYFTIPDANFRAALKNQFSNAFPAGQNDKMDVSHTDVKGFTGIIDVASKSISSLSGIEYFTKLTVLYCYSNQLTSLDVSKNTSLTSLDCSINELTSLDLRGIRSVDILRITTSGTSTNNSGLTSIKVHSSVTSTDPASKLNAELIKVRAAVVAANSANYAQIDSYTSTGTPSVTYASAVCDYNPSTGVMVAGSTKVCKP